MTLSNIQEREFSFHYSVDYVANTLLQITSVIPYRVHARENLWKKSKHMDAINFVSYQGKYLSINIK
jgi:hypothetical protein